MPEGSGQGPGGVEGREGGEGEEPRRREDRVGDGCAGQLPEIEAMTDPRRSQQTR